MGYPQDIKPLTGLRFIAAMWLLVYFFWGRLGVPPEATPGVVQHGYMGVDLFFILSGFVLAHVYGPQVEAGRFHYGAFVWARLARVYPLHLLTLAAMIAIWGAGTLIGATFEPKAFNPEHLIHHLLMIQAWGFVDADGWNFPSWSISAEWFAYLMFPVLFGAVALLRRAPVVALLLSAALTVGLSILVARHGMELHNMTWQGGALRIVPSFLAGCALWQIGRRMQPMAAPLAWAGIAASVAWIVVTAEAALPSAALWPGLVGLVFFMAASATSAAGAVCATPMWVWLGEISFAVYMVHLPVDIAFYQIAERVVGVPTGPLAFVLVGVAMALTVAVAAASHAWFEKPVRDLMRRHAPAWFRSGPAQVVAARSGAPAG